MKAWYEQLFDNYANTYENEDFTKGTTGEVDFIEEEMGYDKSKAILDIGCGTGRHAIELTRRGYRVTGIDLSESQLQRARENAAAAGLAVEFLQRDARAFKFPTPFDQIIMLCEGGFSLMDSDEENFAILRCASRALKKNGKFIFSNLNVLFPLYHSVKDFLNSNATTTVSDAHQFDLMTFREHSTLEVSDDLGRQKTLRCNERYYAPSEITWLLKSLGFSKVDIHGCKLGRFSRTDPLTIEDYEMLVIAVK